MDHRNSVVFKKDRIDESWTKVKIDGLEAFKSSKTRFGKCFWLIMIIVASVILIYELYKSVDNFLNSPTRATYKILPETKMDFPDVYLCSTNFVKQSQLINDNVTEKTARLYRTLSGYANLNMNTECGESESEYEIDYNAEILYKDFMTLGYGIKELFKTCSFRKFVFESLECTEVIKPVLDANYGKCFIISMQGRQQMLGAQALMLALYLPQEDFPQDPCLMPDTEGVIISVGKPPSNPINTKMSYVKSGTYNRIDLTSRHFTFLNVNTSSIKQFCIENPKIFDFEVLNSKTVIYSQTACQNDCQLQILVKTCDCLPILDINYINPLILAKNISYCSFRRQKDCIHKRIAQSKFAQSSIDNCSKKCYPPCEMYTYPTRVTSLPLNEGFFPPIYKVRTNLMYLLISFANMETENFQQNPGRSFDDMVSNLGGQINLWVGSSMLTLIQLPIVLLMISWWGIYELIQRCRGDSTEDGDA